MNQYELLEQKVQPGDFSQYDMIPFLPVIEAMQKGECYVEIGTHKGRSLSVVNLVKTAIITIVGVDVLKQPELALYLDLHQEVKFIWADSVFAASVWDNLSYAKNITVLFIDGDHSYAGCKRDIDAWYPKMKKGGVMFFHDCDETSPGVMRAVTEFSQSIGKKVEIFKTALCNTSLAKIQL